MLDCELFGLKPGWHHFTNLVLHVANTVLLFAVLRQLTGAVWASAMVAALFAIHPMHVESVAWVAERKDLLSTLFFLLTLSAYARYARNPSISSPANALRPLTSGAYWLALLWFSLALMSKPMVVTLPFVLLLLDCWPLNRFRLTPLKGQLVDRPALGIREKLPFFLLSGAACIVALGVEQDQRNFGGVVHYPLSSRVLNALTSYFEYLRKIVWPSDLAVYYPYPNNWPLGTVTGVRAAARSFVSGDPLAASALSGCWLVLVSGHVGTGDRLGAGRDSRHGGSLYLPPAIGLFIAIVFGCAAATARLRNRSAALAALALLTLVGSIVATRSQLGHWRDSETLFRHAIKVTGGNSVAYNNFKTR